MTTATPTVLQRKLASEFGRRRWHYDADVVGDLIEHIERTGAIDPAALARRVPRLFREHNDATVDDLTDAIAAAIGGRTPVADSKGATLIIDDHSHHLTLGANARITGGNVNLGGTQIVVRADAPKEEILADVAALMRAAVSGAWNAAAARELAEVVDARDDVDYGDVHAVTVEVLEEEPPKQGRAKQVLEEIATSGVGGALGTGIIAGIGELLGQLPTQRPDDPRHPDLDERPADLDRREARRARDALSGRLHPQATPGSPSRRSARSTAC